MPLPTEVNFGIARLENSAESNLDQAAPEIHQRAEDAGLLEEF
jgi:hypothetical protein